MKSIRQTLDLNVSVRLAIIALALSLGACGVLPQQNEPRQNDPRYDPASARIAGVVNYVDTANNEIEITTDRNSRVAPGQRIDLHYNNRTTVEFEGNSYRPQDLEQGDRIVADVEGDSRSLKVRSIVVTQNSSYGGGYQSNDLYISGTLQKIDKRNKRLTIDSNDRGRETKVRFNKKTRVLVGNRDIEITDLREYDRLNIVLAPGKSDALAETITVIDGGYGSDFATTRGQVLSVDESRRELVIATQDYYRQSGNSTDTSVPRTAFDKNKDDRTTFEYEQGIIVEYQGEYYSPANLERGDTVDVDYERIGDELRATRILVISSVRN